MEKERLKELAGIITEDAWGNTNIENIYDNLSEMDLRELIKSMMNAANDSNSLTLIEYLKSYDINGDDEDEDDF